MNAEDRCGDASCTSLLETIEEYLHYRSAGKPSPHTVRAWRADLRGVCSRIAVQKKLALDRILCSDLDRPVLRSVFASWASDHSGSSTHRCWSTWNGLCHWLVEEDRLSANPMTGVPRPKAGRLHAKPHRDEEAVFRLLQTAATKDKRAYKTWPERDLALVAVFVATGIRLSEVTTLTLGSVGGPLDARRLTVTGKGNKTRVVPITTNLEVILCAYLETRGKRHGSASLDDPAFALFVHYDGEPMTVHNVSYVIRCLYRRAGIVPPPGASVHALRHTFATEAVANGADIVEVQRLLGHANLATTSQYLDATADRLREAVQLHPAEIVLAQQVEQVQRTDTEKDSF